MKRVAYFSMKRNLCQQNSDYSHKGNTVCFSTLHTRHRTYTLQSCQRQKQKRCAADIFRCISPFKSFKSTDTHIHTYRQRERYSIYASDEALYLLVWIMSTHTHTHTQLVRNILTLINLKIGYILLERQIIFLFEEIYLLGNNVEWYVEG
jgi:hypothetical protein